MARTRLAVQKSVSFGARGERERERETGRNGRAVVMSETAMCPVLISQIYELRGRFSLPKFARLLAPLVVCTHHCFSKCANHGADIAVKGRWEMVAGLNGGEARECLRQRNPRHIL